MTDKLLNCPFCGGEAEVFQVSTPTYEEFVVTCRNRNCCAFYIGYGDTGFYPTEQKAIEAWNTREPMDRIVEQLKEYQRNYSSGLGGFTDELVDRVLRNAIEIVKAGGKDE